MLNLSISIFMDVCIHPLRWKRGAELTQYYYSQAVVFCLFFFPMDEPLSRLNVGVTSEGKAKSSPKLPAVI